MYCSTKSNIPHYKKAYRSLIIEPGITAPVLQKTVNPCILFLFVIDETDRTFPDCTQSRKLYKKHVSL